MAAETTLTYNGVTLRNVLTRRFVQTSEYDASGTDLVCFKFSLSVLGYLHSGSTSNSHFGIYNTTSQSTGAARFAALRSNLMEPRGDLRYVVGDDPANPGQEQELLAVYGPHIGRTAHQVDVKNGPQPRDCSITQVVGSDVLEVEFTIDAWILECRDGTSAAPSHDAPGNQSGVLSNRWSCVDSIDKNMRTTRTISGLLRTATGSVNPNAMRDFVVPRLQMGFRRDSMSFKVTPDALSLEYNIIDKEVTHSPPPPATSWNYIAREQTSDAKIGTSSIDVTLSCPRDVDKSELVRIAVAIVKSRLYDGDFTNNFTILEDLTITDSYGDDVNSINVQARVMRAQRSEVATIGARTKNIGKPISATDLAGVADDYNANRSRGNYPADTLEIEGPIPLTSAWQSYLQTPCDDAHRVEEAYSSTSNGPLASTRVDYQLNAAITQDVGDPTDYTNTDHKEAIYTHFELESKYQTDEHNVALPVAGQRYTQTPDTPTFKPVGLALPTTTRTIRLLAKRLGKMPKLPDPKKSYKIGNGTAVLMRNVTTPNTPERTADGKELHTVRAEYQYALTVPPQSGDSLPIGTNPWEDPAFAKHTTDPKMLTGDAP